MHEIPEFVEKIDYNDIRLLKVVGRGSFGVVSKGIWREKIVAVKRFESENEKKAFLVEVRQMCRVSHPNIVRLYGACRDPGPVCLIMEFAEGGSLYDVLHGHPRPEYTAAHAMSWALQCATAVAYLHSIKPKALIHRDLKPPNLLLIAGGKTLKVCDFGTACDIRTYMTNNKGSAAWMAPEVFEASKYSEKCDVFSWGIIIWELLTRQKPFEHIGGPAFRIMWAVHTGQRPPLIKGCPQPIEDLMTKCWHKDPQERPSMEEVVKQMTHLSSYFPGHEETLKYPHNSSDEEPPYTEQSETDISCTLDPDTTEPEGSTGPPRTVKREQSEDSQIYQRPPREGGLLITADTNNDTEATSMGSLDLSSSLPSNLETPPPIPVLPPLPPGISIKTKLSPGAVLPTTTNTSNTLKRRSADFSKIFPQSELPSHSDLKAIGHRRSVSHDSGTKNSHSSLGRQQGITPSDDELSNAHLLVDPELRPITPCTSSAESMRIYEEHKETCKSYILVRREIEQWNNVKSELTQRLKEAEPLDSMGESEAQRLLEEYMELQNERESLLTFSNTLKRQLELIQQQQTPNDNHREAEQDGEDWVVLNNNKNK